MARFASTNCFYYRCNSVGYAAAFFLLADKLQDAVNVCVKNLSDFQLAIAICRVYEQGIQSLRT